MDLIFSSILLLLLSFLVCAWFLQILKQKPPHKSGLKLPPGPKPYPIIGNILELGKNPHQDLAKLAHIYGPLIHLKLGTITAVVISSPEMARNFLQKHDQAFSNRWHTAAVQAHDHTKYSVVWSPAENHWRKLRKILKEEMFSVASLDAREGVRMGRMHKLREYVNECCVNGKAVEIGRLSFTTILNQLSVSIFSEEVTGFEAGSLTVDFKKEVWGILESAAQPNIADAFPVFRVLDPQGIARKNGFHAGKCYAKFDEVIQRRLKVRGNGTRENDVLDSLLDIHLRDASELSIRDIKHLLLDFFVAGTDTSSSIVEWVITELLRHPHQMVKVHNELREVVGKKEQVTEQDIPRLPYLRAVLKEAFRFHPPVPLLLPRKCREDTEINGYIIPKDTQIHVNVWAMGRDPSNWADPMSFIPERFLERETDFKGQHFELLPMGGGRRMCAGVPLANRMVHLIIATLIHNFEWKLDGGLKPEEVDISESFGSSLQKAIPLKAVPSILA